MKIALDFSPSELALLQKQADECNRQPNRTAPLTAQDVMLQELQPVADGLLSGLIGKFASSDRDAVIAAAADPVKLAAMKAAIADVSAVDNLL